MAALPENNTNRLFIDYITGNQASSVEHTLSVRYRNTVTPADVQGDVYDVLNAIGTNAFSPGWRVLRARAQDALSDFSYPVSLVTALGAFVGDAGAVIPPREEPREWRWVGRSYADGRKVSFSLYGIIGTTPDNFRLPRGGSSPAWVALSLNVLAGMASSFITISGFSANWYSYVNVQYNTYWEAAVRAG